LAQRRFSIVISEKKVDLINCIVFLSYLIFFLQMSTWLPSQRRIKLAGNGKMSAKPAMIGKLTRKVISKTQFHARNFNLNKCHKLGSKLCTI